MSRSWNQFETTHNERTPGEHDFVNFLDHEKNNNNKNKFIY